MPHKRRLQRVLVPLAGFSSTPNRASLAIAYHSDQWPLACSQTLAWGWAVNASPRPDM